MLTGDASRLDAHGTLIRFAAILVVGLLAGFAAGYVVGQRGTPIPAARSAAAPISPAEPRYTESRVEPATPSGGRVLAGWQPAGAVDRLRTASGVRRERGCGGQS